MVSKEETTTQIEYTNDKGREVLVCKKTGIKTQYDPKKGLWKVGQPVGSKYGMSISVSGGGVEIFMSSARLPIFYGAIGFEELVPEGMYFPAETVIDIIPLLDVASRVSLWLQRNPEYPKHSGCILPGSGFTQQLIDGETH